MQRGHGRHGLCGWSLAALIASVAWTVAITPARAYQLEVSEAGAHVRWHVPEVALQLDPALDDFFADVALRELMREAAAAWSGVEGAPSLQIVDGTAPAAGFHDVANANGVYLARDWRFEPDALATTVATFESDSGRLIDTDVFINAHYQFAWIEAGAKDKQHYDLLAVVTHELGHVLGLGDSTNAPEATMSPYFKRGDTHQRDLAEDDERGLAESYGEVGAEEGTQAGCGGASVLRARAESPVERRTIIAAALIMIALWIRSRTRRAQYTLVFGGVLLFGVLPTQRATTNAQLPRDPAPWRACEQPEARQRIESFTRGAQRLLEGRAAFRGSYRRDGLIWSRFVVRADGAEVALELPGGALEGVTQVVSGRALPAEGDQLLIAERAAGPHAWAKLRGGLAFGGALGDGPALPWR